MGIDKIPTVLNQAGNETLGYEVYILVNYVWYKQELPLKWKKYIIIPICKKGDEIVCISRNITVINFIQHFIRYSFLKVISRNRSTADRISYVCQILEKNETSM
jgi:hypothetical protein